LRLLIQIMTFLILTLTVQSCATFPKSKANYQLSTVNNLTRINGQYKVKAEKDSFFDSTYIGYHNAFEKFYRGKGRSNKDTMVIDNLDKYSFEIKLFENKKVELTYLKDNISFRKLSLQYELKDDGYVYIKNKNFKILGIPYLFGSIDINKLRLSSIDNYLIIEEVHHNSGAILLIFGDSKTWNYTHKYERIE